MKWFKLAIEDRKIILQQASALSGINEKALEKDLWITTVLEAVFKTPFASEVTTNFNAVKSRFGL